MVKGKYANTIRDIMNVGLNLINEWSKREGLRINPSKTIIVPFTRKRNLETFKGLKVGSTCVEISDSVKYLGLILDKRWTWNPHINNIIRKAKGSLITCRRCVGSSWGLKPQIGQWLYVSVIRPRITYGALVWWGKAQQSTVATKLASLQRLACLITTGAFKSTPTAALEILLRLPPLDLYLKAEATLAAYRLINTDNWKKGNHGYGHTLIQNDVESNSVLAMRSDLMITEYCFDHSFEIQIGTRQDWSSKQIPKRLQNHLIWFTDGSRDGTHSGAGVYSTSPRTELSFSLGRYTTVFQAEIYAIQACAQKSLEKGYKDKNLLILSDSQAALKALDSHQYNSKLVWDCLQTLQTLSQRNSVVLGWVPGHQGIEGNERADQLAKRGVTTLHYGPEPFCGISKLQARTEVMEKTRKEHHKRWNSSGQSLCKHIVRESNDTFTRSLLHLSRSRIRRAVGLITGHGHFKKHLRTVGIIHGDISCRLCGQQEETAKHLLLECEALGRTRHQVFGTSVLDKLKDPIPGKGVIELIKSKELEFL